MSTMNLVSSVLAALLLTSVLSGCSISVTDPTEAKTPSEQSQEEAPSTDAGDEPASDPASSGLSAEGQEQRDSMIASATTTMPCPTTPLTQDGTVIRVEGHCTELVIEVDGGVVIADDVDTLILNGVGSAVFVEAVGSLVVSGDANSVFWAGQTPSVDDTGIANVLRRG